MYLQMDDLTVEERAPTKIHLWKFQAKQLSLNPQPVHLSAIESLTIFLSFLF